MLTRLHVKGFKNLIDTEVHFGPFTCFVGANAVGKSNLFDALLFLRDLSELPIMEAALRVRGSEGPGGDARALFSKTARGQRKSISFDMDLVVPRHVDDDFGRPSAPTATFLNYQLELRLVELPGAGRADIELHQERLTYIASSSALERLRFPHARAFRESVVSGPGKRTSPFITTQSEGTDSPEISLHIDGGRSGKAFKVPARASPRTILGGTNTNSHPTVLAARREMQSWKLLQLEPTALRRPDEFSADSHLSPTGENLPSTLLRLGAEVQVANRLAELLPDVKRVIVDQDQGRRLRSVVVSGRDGVPYPARSLSDGMLRFLALAVLSFDNAAGSLICLEEPENGLHPARVSAMVKLLQDMACDPHTEISEDNPLRQIVINTHSPLVVSQLPKDDVIFVQTARTGGSGAAIYRALPGTWRDQQGLATRIAPGDMLDYLSERPSFLRGRPRVPEQQATVFDVGTQLGLLDLRDEYSPANEYALHVGS